MKTEVAILPGNPEAPPASAPSRVLLVLDPARVWRWQAWIRDALEDDGCTVAVQFVEPRREAFPSALHLLVALEHLLFAKPPDAASDLLNETEIRALPLSKGSARYDLAIDFTGAAERINATRILRPTFDGVAGDVGAAAAVLAHRAPNLGLLDSKAGVIACGTCALEDRDVFTRGLDGVFSRMAGQVLSVARHADTPGSSPALPAASPVAPGFSEPLTFFTRAVATKASARLSRLLGQAPRWYVAWRRGANTTLDIPWQDFTSLADGGERFYADPFVLLRGDTAHVFCEEVPFATGKGIISHFTIDAHGNATSPRPVLERPYHLSYPFVFERGGETWMIPETSGNRTVELYRAERFPDRWVKEAVLLDRLLADDATLVEHAGRLWMFAGVRNWQASSWEALGLFHATSLMGPWHAHTANPVLLDPGAARPAGALFSHEGTLIRPVQDSREGYGAGLAFARVDRLDEEGFAQEVVARITPRSRATKGLHTYNRAGDVEVVDLFGRR